MAHLPMEEEEIVEVPCAHGVMSGEGLPNEGTPGIHKPSTAPGFSRPHSASFLPPLHEASTSMPTTPIRSKSKAEVPSSRTHFEIERRKHRSSRPTAQPPSMLRAKAEWEATARGRRRDARLTREGRRHRVPHSRKPRTLAEANRFLATHPIGRPGGCGEINSSHFGPRPHPVLLPPRKPLDVAPDVVFRENYKSVVEIMDEEWRTFKAGLLKNPMYSAEVSGIMNPRRTITTVRPVIDLDEESEDEFDETDLSSFFRLSQQTGFSKQHLCDIFKKWITVTRKDMNPQQFALWMKSIGFQDRLIILRLFEIFDEDGGGSISFGECAVGLSYIEDRDITLPKFIIDQDDQHFYKVCFKLLDLTNDDAITRFEMFKILSSALQTNSHDTNELVDKIWSKVCPNDPEMKETLKFPTFKAALAEHRFLWRFFRHLLPLQSLARNSKEYAVGRKHTKNIIDLEQDVSDSEGEDDDEDVELLGPVSDLDDVLPEWKPDS